VLSEVHSLSDSSCPCWVVSSDHQVLLCDRQGFATQCRVAALLHCQANNKTPGHLYGSPYVKALIPQGSPCCHPSLMWGHPHQPEFLPW
jgi:hypothetical protein